MKCTNSLEIANCQSTLRERERESLNMPIKWCELFIKNLSMKRTSSPEDFTENSIKHLVGGTWLAHSVKHVTLNLRVVRSSPTRGVEMTKKTFREEINPILHKYYQKREEKGMSPNSFHEASNNINNIKTI